MYGALALTVDFPRAAFGFKSDEATYYMMAYSLAEDGDLTYTKDDLVRVWREFPGGPSGVFLKKGRTLSGAPDPNPNRLYYGKSFIYPLVAAPFVKVFGTNGFLVLHALLLSIVVLCGYLFLHARSSPLVSALLASGFVMVSVVPVYFVWLMPEVFNFSLTFLAYFCWLYKEVATPQHAPRGAQWLFTGRSDAAAAVLLGIATFSKVTTAMLFVPTIGSCDPHPRDRRSVPSICRRLVCDQQADLRRLELSGGRSPQLLRRVSIPERDTETRPWTNEVARRHRSPRDRVQPAHVHIESHAQPRVLLHRPPYRTCRVFLPGDGRDGRILTRAASAPRLAMAGPRIGSGTGAHLSD
ncbi:MAG: hypothetical protein E6G39_02355 [Actinobacteria bacterium]|nr:MAG: hypothetical protein E6G39_02355 [Actinomycetota bacterium]